MLEASVKRAAVAAFRIACVIALLRSLEKGERLDLIDHITPTGFEGLAGMTLSSVYLAHGLSYAGTLPTSADPAMTTKKAAWLATLPIWVGEFQRRSMDGNELTKRRPVFELALGRFVL